MTYEPLPQERFDEIEACLNAATPGPWEITKHRTPMNLIISKSEKQIALICGNHSGNKRLIANAPTYLQKLLNEVKRLKALIGGDDNGI